MDVHLNALLKFSWLVVIHYLHTMEYSSSPGIQICHTIRHVKVHSELLSVCVCSLSDGLLSDRPGFPLWPVHAEAEAAGRGTCPQPGWGEHPAGAEQRQGDSGGWCETDDVSCDDVRPQRRQGRVLSFVCRCWRACVWTVSAVRSCRGWSFLWTSSVGLWSASPTQLRSSGPCTR